MALQVLLVPADLSVYLTFCQSPWLQSSGFIFSSCIPGAPARLRALAHTLVFPALQVSAPASQSRQNQGCEEGEGAGEGERGSEVIQETFLEEGS